MDKLAVIGYPLNYTLSPYIHNKWIQIYNINAKYYKEAMDNERFHSFMTSLKDSDYIGCNVTIPYKELAINYCDILSDNAKNIGAINTLKIEDRVICGYNTDYEAMVEIFSNLNSLNTKDNILIIGAGGFAKAVIHALLDKGFYNIFIQNRTSSRISEMGDKVKNYNQESIAMIIIAIPNHSYLYKDLADSLSIRYFPKVVIDATYGEDSNIMHNACIKHDVTYISGADILLLQAQKSFKIWFGIEPEIGNINLLKNIKGKD